MNAIPAISGFGTSGDGSAGAVASFAIDLDRRRLVAADAAAAGLWNLAETGGEPAIPLDLDAGMPGLATLAARIADRQEQSGPVALTFWTRAGVRTWPCLVRREQGAAGERLVHVIVVEALAVGNLRPDAPGAVPGAESPPLAPGAASPQTAAKLAHELRTPLSAILTMADVLAEQRFGPLPDARYSDYARTIGDAARHAIGVVAAMLAPDRPPEARAEPTFVELDIEALAAECARSIETLAARGDVQVECAMSGGLPRVIADRVAVQQIVLNLLSNALEHAGAGARVILRSGCEPAGEVWLEVADDGPGIAAPHATKEGEPAVAGPRGSNAEGRGIGLPLARSLAEENGARLQLAAVEPHGTAARLAFAASRTVPV